MSCDEDLATDACGALTTERLRYFTGRHMTARDFEDEQKYHRTHRLWHNRMLHGWGIVCGLQVQPHPTPDCRHDRVVVRCGMAIDCCGRELVLRHDVVAPPIPWDDRPKVDGANGRVPDPATVLLLCLEYCEAPTEKVPVLYSESACASATMEYGRVCEGVRTAWHWVRRDALATYGWRTKDDCAPGGDVKTPPSRDGGGEARCCVDVDCPEHECLALAVLTDGPNGEKGAPVIDVNGRRPLGEARGQLTHICWISWPHGGIVSPKWLIDNKSRLIARFDRELEVIAQPVWKSGTRGINPCTFVVEEGEIFEDMDPVPYRVKPYLEADRRTAVYELRDPDPGPVGPFRSLIGHVIHVTIKCEFLLDSHGLAVDGNHVGGRLPTGNGTPGGTFESWFEVVTDDDYAALMKAEAEKTAAAHDATET